MCNLQKLSLKDCSRILKSNIYPSESAKNSNSKEMLHQKSYIREVVNEVIKVVSLES